MIDLMRDWLERHSPAAREVNSERTKTDAALRSARAARKAAEQALGESFKAADGHLSGRHR